MKKTELFTKVFPVNLDDSDQVEHFKQDLLAKWEFDEIKTGKILRKYHGQLKKYSALHVEIMYNLLCCHLRSMKPDERRAYIIGQKVNYTALGDITGLEFFFTCAFNWCLASVTLTQLPISEKILIGVLLVIMGITIVFIKQSRKPRFHLEILSAVENDLLSDQNNE